MVPSLLSSIPAGHWPFDNSVQNGSPLQRRASFHA